MAATLLFFSSSHVNPPGLWRSTSGSRENSTLGGQTPGGPKIGIFGVPGGGPGPRGGRKIRPGKNRQIILLLGLAVFLPVRGGPNFGPPRGPGGVPGGPPRGGRKMPFFDPPRKMAFFGIFRKIQKIVIFWIFHEINKISIPLEFFYFIN